MSEVNLDNLGMNEETNFDLPQNYFQNSAKSIRAKIEWHDEHAGYKNLLELKYISQGTDNGFTLPDNYFQQSELKAVHLIYPKLNSLKNHSHYTIPKYYFYEFSKNISKKLLQTESEKQNSTFEINLINSTRIIPLFWRRISVAMAAILLMSFGFWIFNSNETQVNKEACNTIACLEKQTIVNNLVNLNLDNDDLYDLVDPADLEQEIGSKNYSSSENNINKTDSDQTISNELLNDF